MLIDLVIYKNLQYLMMNFHFELSPACLANLPWESSMLASYNSSGYTALWLTDQFGF